MQVQLDRDEENLYLFLLQLVLLLYPGEDLRHVGLQHHSAHDQLVEDEVDLVHVEDEVELAHVLEALVQRLHEHLDEVEDAQLGLGAVHAEDEVEGGVVPVDELVVGSSNQAGRERRKMYFFQRNGKMVTSSPSPFQEVADVVLPLGHQLEGLLHDLLLLALGLKKYIASNLRNSLYEALKF